MPVAHPIEPRVLAGAHQVPRCLELGRGNMDRLQQAAGEQPCELARVPWVGLDTVARPPGTSPGAITAQSIPRATRYR